MLARVRSGLPIVLLLGGMVAVLLLMPGGPGLKSPQETQKVLDELGIKWRHPGPPVVVFTSPG